MCSALVRALGLDKSPLHKGNEAWMRFLESWWERTPLYVRIGLFVASIVAMVLGGASGAYWE